MRASNFKHLVKEGIENTWFNRVMSFASFCILLVGLLICGLATLLIQDIRIIIGNVEDENMAIIYMLQETTTEQIENTLEKLQNYENVTDVVHVTKEEALQIMLDKMSYAAEDVDQIFDGLDGNEFMPDSFKMTIVDLAKIDEVSAYLSEIENVETVYVPTDFANQLKKVERIVEVIGLTVLVALVAVCLIIITNTTRASVFTRKKEISIMKYVGATNSFIRIPFLVEGAFIGLLAAVAAWGLTWLGYDALYNVIVTNGDLHALGVYDLLHFSDVKWIVLLVYCVASVTVSAIGNIISLRKHVKV